MSPELQALQKRIEVLEQHLNQIQYPGRWQFDLPAKFNTKVGFFGKPPAARVPAISQPNSQGASYNGGDAQTLTVAVNNILLMLQAYGLIP